MDEELINLANEVIRKEMEFAYNKKHVKTERQRQITQLVDNFLKDYVKETDATE